MVPRLHILRTPDGVDFPLPSYTSKHHIGLVLRAAVPSVIKLESGERVYIPIGFSIGIPDGFCGQIVSFPDIAKEMGLVVMGSPQIINPADRGPLFVLIQNESRRQQILRRGQIIAQLVVTPAYQVTWNEIETDLPLSDQTSVDTILFDDVTPTAEEAPEPTGNIHRREVKSIRERVKAADA